MKKILTFLFSIYYCFAFPHTVKQPQFKHNNFSYISLDSVVSSQTESIFYFSTEEARSLCFTKNIYIVKESGDSVKAIDFNNVPICPQKLTLRENEFAEFSITFPYVGDCKNGELVEVCDKKCLRITEIVLDSVRNERIKLFEKAEEYYYANLLETSQNLYLKLLENPLDTTDLIYGECLLKVPLIYSRLKKWNEAKVWYEKLINSNLNDSLETMHYLELYSNFKHHASLGLANIHTIGGRYDLALDYIQLAKNKYPYVDYDTLTPNGIQEKVDIAMFESYILQAKGEFEKAFHLLLGLVINEQVPASSIVSQNVLQPYMYANNALVMLISKQFDKKQILNEFEKAFQNLKYKKNGVYVECQIEILGKKYNFKVRDDDKSIKVLPKTYEFYGYEILKKDENYFKDIFRKKPFYKRLSQIEANEIVDTSSTVYYKDKPLTGICYEYFENGRISAAGNYKDGKLHGLFTAYYQNGQKYYEGTFASGLEEGVFKTFYESGNLKEEGEFKQGMRKGLWTAWYDVQNAEFLKNGEIMSSNIDSVRKQQKEWQVVFKEDKEHGEWKSWHENGQLRELCIYKNGKQEGMVKNWYDNGQLQMEGKKKGGEFTGLCTTYYETGEIQTIVETKDGKFNGQLVRYYENGKEKEKCTYIEDQPDGQCSEWYNSGQKKIEFNFTNGQLNGTWTQWNEAGEVLKHGFYREGQLVEGDSLN